jgi:glycosyltransferase involved in cell wall biosynthesis
MSLDLSTRAAASPLGGTLGPTPIRVASVPASHVYIRHLAPLEETPDARRIERLADPDPNDAGRSAVSTWWPPRMLDPEWIRTHDFDVFHIQFGFDARTPDELRALVAALRDSGRPLVHTVHDLRNPHHATRDEHDAQLDVLIPAADAVITLTPGAAAEIHRRWGRAAIVLPHPHVVEPERARAAAMRSTPRLPDAEFRVGVHVKSLRASMNPLPVLRVLAAAVADIPGGSLQVNGHRDVLLPGGARYDAELGAFLRHAEAHGMLEVRVHDFLPDAELWDYLESLDASVLPYRFGTHSGWLEACRDLGTAVIAPTCGYYREQGPVFSFDNDEGGLDADSLVAAVHAAHAAGAPAPVPIGERMRQRQAVADAHARLYRDLLR